MSARRICRWWCLALLLPAVTAGAAGPPEAEASLYDLLDARLELMDEVAAYKWLEGLPVEDPAREAVVVEHAVAEGLRYGLSPDSSARLFRAQIEAAKEIQRHHFARWERAGGPEQAADLNASVRPELLRLGTAISAAAARLEGPPSAPQFLARVQVEGLGADGRSALLAALEGLSVYANHLDQVLGSGRLRVGTTGDYAPFSHRDDGAAQFRGIDVDLARHLGAALGVEVEFVATSWPGLLQDLAEGRFDIAMSGVSRTLERQKQGYLSSGYHAGGKTPIARCDAADGFAGLAAVNRPGVRVIVNPGGTNEAFVDAYLGRAEKVLHGDNRTIFQALEDGVADVMITDRVEVSLQTALRPALCATMADNFTYQEKAYLLPRDEPWRAFVETWLSLALAEGVVGRVFADHGVAHQPPGIR